MKKIFDFGKIAYNGKQKNNRVTVEVELKERESGNPEFSASGEIWNSRGTDCICGGQCLDTIKEFVKNPVFLELFAFWKKYHLNGMRPECEHQRALGWGKLASETVNIYKYTMTHAAIMEKRAIESKITEAARCGKSYIPSKTEQKIINLSYSLKIPTESPDENIAEYYKLEQVEKKLKGWIKPSEHPAGILCKPCPVCGYEYGSKWLYMPIPEKDLERIKQILSK